MDIAVLFLARFAEGAERVRRFIESYKAHPAGHAHDLIAIQKGFPIGNVPHEYEAALAPPFTKSLSFDDSGVDITVYGKAAQLLTHKYVVFFNTHTEIVSVDWLAKLHQAIQKRGIGIAGAMGSYESLFSSWTEINRVLFHCMNGMPYDATVSKMLEYEIRKHVPEWLDLQEGKALKPAYDKVAVDRSFFDFWTSSANEQYEAFAKIAGFPNPHVRTNGFMIERQTFLATHPFAVHNKTSALLYESGPEGLTKSVIRMGLEPVIVGANGENYTLDSMRCSNTFRLGMQQNLLIHDNQTRRFAEMPLPQRQFSTQMTWQPPPFGERSGLTDLNVALRNVLAELKQPEGARREEYEAPMSNELQLELKALRKRIAQLEFENDAQRKRFLSSTSWRVTKPLRAISRIFRSFQA